MKKGNILIAAFAVLAAAGTAGAVDLNFDGARGGAFGARTGLAAAVRAQQESLPVQAEIMPARTFTPEESIPMALALARLPQMDRTIKSAIKYAEGRKMGRAKASFEWLLRNGTPQQKFAYVYGDRSVPYRFPAAAGQQPELQKDLIDDFLHWVCRTYTEFVVQYNCHPTDDGDEKCDQELVELITESCGWE